jgi:uncharacterized Tic20 family protein
MAPPYVGGPAFAGNVKPTNQLAMWSMISSLIGILCGIGLIVGPILGFVALGQLKEPGNNQGGKGMATAGIAIGLGMIVLWILILAIGGISFHTGTLNMNNCFNGPGTC